MCILFAILTVFAMHRKMLSLASTQIPVLPIILLVLMVVAINPMLRLFRVIRPFSGLELLVIFMMGMVSSGVSTFGLADQLIPIVGSLYYREWNHDQSEWSRYVGAFVDDDYFLSEEGVTEAARAYHSAYEALLADRVVFDAAVRFQDAEARVASARAEYDAWVVPGVSDAAAGLKAALARAALESAETYAREAAREWEALAAARHLPSRDEVLRDYPERLRHGESQVADLKARLQEVEQFAFEKVQLFRRGLPATMRAYPGIIPLDDDNARGYWDRLRRLRHGLVALRMVRAASANLAGPVPAQAEAVSSLRDACAELGRISHADAYIEFENRLRHEEAQIVARKLGLVNELKDMERQQLHADRAQLRDLDRRLARHRKLLDRIEEERREVARQIEKNAVQRAITARVSAMAARLGATADGLVSGALKPGDARSILDGMIAEFPAMDASLRRFFLGEVPWGHWVEPLLRWALYIGLTYLLLMALNVLIFRQWAHNEKLTYPLMELPRSLLPPDKDAGMIPPIFYNTLFWVGLAISASVLGWNYFCSTQLLPGLKPIDLTNWWQPYVQGKALHALVRARCMIFFTMMGLAFIIPKNVSFSLWFFHVVYMVQLLVMVWIGHGVDERSFPSDWYYMLNFRTAQGQGAIIVFALFVLYKCRRYFLCAFRPASLDPHLEPDERRELRFASAIFLFGSVLLVLMLWLDMGANLGHTLFAYFVIVVITIGLIRAVTEGGLLGFQAWVSPFHFLRAFFGLDKSWTSPALFAPLLMYYSLLFMDIKTFIAPAMANSLKLREDFRMRRGVFHLVVFLAIGVSAVTAVVFSLMMAYSPGGADSMHNWFYKGLPQWTFDTLRSMLKDAPHVSESARAWTMVGASAMALLMYFRQSMFWLPHPIGLVMFVNPIMGAYWFSIFLGWLANVAVTKYGNKNSFHQAKGFFIGLIIGELLMVALSFVLVMVWEIGTPIDLNRN